MPLNALIQSGAILRCSRFVEKKILKTITLLHDDDLARLFLQISARCRVITRGATHSDTRRCLTLPE